MNSFFQRQCSSFGRVVLSAVCGVSVCTLVSSQLLAFQVIVPVTRTRVVNGVTQTYQVMQVIQDGRAIVGGLPGNGLAPTMSGPSAASPGDAAAEKIDPKEELLFAQLQQVKFDRRPSMILRTWADLQAAVVEGQVQGYDEYGDPIPSGSPSPAGDPDAQEESSEAAVAFAPELPLPAVDAPPLPLSDSQLAAIEMAKTKELTAVATKEAKSFAQFVTIGKWREATEILRQLKPENQKVIYSGMLSQLATIQREYEALAVVSEQESGEINNQNYLEKNTFTLDDLSGVLAMAPVELQKSEIAQLGQLISGTLEGGVIKEALKDRLSSLVAATPNADFVAKKKTQAEIEAEKLAKEQAAAAAAAAGDAPAEVAAKEVQAAKPIEAWLTRRQAAWLLIYAGQLDLVESFLPSAQACEASGDNEGLNIIARLYIQKSVSENDDQLLNQAWDVIQVVIKTENVATEDKNEALLRAVALAPKLDDQIGQAWLDDLFKNNLEKAKEVLAVIGERASRGMQSQPYEADSRGQTLEMVKTATQSLLKQNPAQHEQWRDLLGLLAAAWLREAKLTKEMDQSTSLGPRLQRDTYGNFYYYDYEMQNNPYRYRNGQMPEPVTTEKILDTIPEGEWFDAIDESLKPEISILCANLLLKVNEDERAFPYIEALVKTNKEQAQSLAEEFLRVWTTNHDMNAERGNNRYSPYYFSYGFNQSAESIPLTRSKQERNLQDLTKWVQKLRELQDVEVDQELLANAFTTCHSGAEVYRFDEIETVFGPMESIDPDVLAALCDRMRTNLAGQWRMPDVQKQNQTKRGKKDIQAEVLRGYQLAGQTIDKALAKHPGNWRLLLQKACIVFDDNEYQSVLKTRSDYSSQKNAAFEGFQKAAAAYQSQVATMKTSDYSVDVFEKWFYAMLGATDLAKVTHEQVAEVSQTALIRQAIQSLGERVSDKHLKMFANVVVTRVGMANPAVKFSFLNEGFRITGDMREVTEARRLHEYYQDLVTELELQVTVDGSDEISPEQPFGVYVQINHTPEIERESGGFGRFLQNQNSMYGMYNYGRPTEDYRTKFEETARAVLNEHFEVLSVTFQRETVRSRPLPGREKWSFTPYAYLLLKSRSSEVDRLPAIRMDLDFLDTTGYVVLPIRTQELPLAYAGQVVQPRPFKDLKVTQTLDQREGKDGKLTLEIKAVCLGLAPSLEQILDLEPTEFEIAETTDSQPMVVNFDKDSDEPIILSERTWDIKLTGRKDLASKPDQFQFAVAKAGPGIKIEEMSLMGFQDEDLMELQPVVTLQGNYGEAATPWATIIAIASASLLGLTVITLGAIAATRKKKTPSSVIDLSEVTPFGLVTALEKRLQSGDLAKSQEQELRQEIRRLEAAFFSANASPSAAVSANVHTNSATTTGDQLASADPHHSHLHGHNGSLNGANAKHERGDLNRIAAKWLNP